MDETPYTPDELRALLAPVAAVPQAGVFLDSAQVVRLLATVAELETDRNIAEDDVTALAAQCARLRTEAAALYDEARYGRDVCYQNGYRWAGEVTPYPDNPYRQKEPADVEVTPPSAE